MLHKIFRYCLLKDIGEFRIYVLHIYLLRIVISPRRETISAVSYPHAQSAGYSLQSSQIKDSRSRQISSQAAAFRGRGEGGCTGCHAFSRRSNGWRDGSRIPGVRCVLHDGRANGETDGDGR